MDNFDQIILKELQDLLETDEMETLVKRNDIEDIKNLDSAVMIKHKPTGTESICEEYGSQIRNKAIALVRLCKALRNK